MTPRAESVGQMKQILIDGPEGLSTLVVVYLQAKSESSSLVKSTTCCQKVLS